MPSSPEDASQPESAAEPSLEQARESLDEAIALHQQGQLEEARAIYERILEAQPQHFGALHLLGVVATQKGSPRLAAALIGKAVLLCPNEAVFYSNRGIALQQLERLEAAVASYDRAIAIKADYAEAYYNRGTALKQFDRPGAAVASYEAAVALKPDYAEAYSSRGIALTERQQMDAAVLSYERALAIGSDYADAYCNRGVALQGLGRLDAAIASYGRAIEIKPDYAEAHCNRGSALQARKHFDAAVASYDRAIVIEADYAEAHYNRGISLHERWQLEAALASYDRALILKCDYAEAYSNRGMALQELKRLDAAIASFDRSIAVNPDYADAYWNKSLALLLRGDLGGGWELYEWRWAASRPGKRQGGDFTQPLWLGTESIRDKTILLHSEQGLGDTLQFCRYAGAVAALGARVILEVPKPLVGLLKSLEGVNVVLEAGASLPQFDYHCPLLTLPLVFKTRLTSIPNGEAYVSGDAGKAAIWAARLGVKTRPRVGIAWSGSLVHKNDRNRSLALSSLLAHLPDAFDYVSLQKEVRDLDRATLTTQGMVKHFGEELEDFTDTAALCGLMDVVISVDTSTAHLSGALGKRTWVLLPYVPDWRWLLDRDDTPWYPSLRLYRQDAGRDWAEVLERVRTDLTTLFA